MMVENQKDQKSKATPYNLFVVELKELKGRSADKLHLYVTLTSSNTELAFLRLLEGKGPNWLQGKVEKLRTDLVPSYRETNDREIAEKRLGKLKIDLSKQGFGVNGDSTVWVVYVLDIDPNVEPKILDLGRTGKAIYVGQTSTTRELRVEQHAGRLLSKAGKHIGSRKTKGRNPVLNLDLSPIKEMYTKEDALAFETETHKRLEEMGYRVFGDVQEGNKSD
jgi:hypothetical protein